MSDFKSDLAFGQEAELWLQSCFPALRFSTNKAYDLLTPSRLKVEVKVDRYDPTHTLNYFMELISNDSNSTPGGPFRALEDGVDLYVYIYDKTKAVYIFNTSELVHRIKQKAYRQCVVPNKFYNTIGLLVPRADIADLTLPFDILSK